MIRALFCCLLPIFTAAAAPLDDVLAQFPAQTPQACDDACAALVALGPDAMAELCGKLVPPGGGDDLAARYAWGALANYSGSGGREDARALFVETALKALAGPQDPEVKAFLIEQLQRAGTDAAVPALAALLNDARLGDPAASALTAIGTDAAAQALAAALPNAEGAAHARIAKALADLKRAPYESTAADASQAKPAPGPDNLGPECAALYEAVAARGDAALSDLLAAAANPDVEVRGAALLLAPRISGEAATKAWGDLLPTSAPDLQCAILRMLAARGDATAAPAFKDALHSPEKSMRIAAYAGVAKLDGRRFLNDLVAATRGAAEDDEAQAAGAALARIDAPTLAARAARALPEATPAGKKALLGLLGNRWAAGQKDAVLACLGDADGTVRMAALTALGAMGEADDLRTLADALLSAPTNEERDAARTAVLTAAKHVENTNLRARPLAEALDAAPVEKKPLLMAVLPDIGGNPAFDALARYAADGQDAAVFDAATAALARWPEMDGWKPLRAYLAEAPAASPRRASLFAACVSCAEKCADGPDVTAWCVGDLLALAADDAERAALLKTLARAHCVEALRIAKPLLDNAALKEAAAKCIVAIVCDKPGLDGCEARDAAQAAVAALGGGIAEKKVAERIAAMPPESLDPAQCAPLDDAGFSPLFNGENLDGWRGDTHGYFAEFGTVCCRPGGNLYTDKEYGNFDFRFEFKLTPGANNGLGIRVPFDGHAAYDGMEIQILDDGDPKYADIHPYQAHGSIYGVVPAKRGCLKPAGQWNVEEVIAQGSHITVIVNGMTVVDADLTPFIANGTPDEKDHPGLANAAGCIAFCGHGDKLWFRNLRVKEL